MGNVGDKDMILVLDLRLSLTVYENDDVKQVS